MTFPKDWRDDPDHTTPMTAVALEDLETRVSANAVPRGTNPDQTMALLGDSVTFQNGTVPGTPGGPYSGVNQVSMRGYMNWANTFLGQRFLVLENFGVGGETTAQILARVGDVLGMDPLPGYCVVQGGTNDLADTGITAATIFSNLRSIYDQLLEAGIVVVSCSTIPPGTSAPNMTKLVALRGLISDYAQATPGLLFADFFAQLVDAAGTGAYRSGYSADTIHPNDVGCEAMGKILADLLRPYTQEVHGLISSNADTNLLTNGLMTGNSSGIATSWTNFSSGTVTKTKVARTDGVNGEWQQFALGSAAATGSVYQFVTAAPADVLVAEIEYEADDNWTNAQAFNVSLTFDGPNTTAYALERTNLDTVALTRPQARGVLRTIPSVAPVGTTSAHITIQFIADAGTVRFSRARVRKLN